MKLLPEFRMPDEPVRPGVRWDLGHLRPALIATAVLTVIGVAVGAILGDGRVIAGAVLGQVIVALFFCISSWVTALAGKRDDRLTLPAALGAYVMKTMILALVLVALPHDGPLDVRAMAISVVVGVVVWSAIQIIYVVRKRQFYVEYHPPTNEDYDQ